MLWDVIRDFFVQYIFGGVDSNLNVFNGIVGSLLLGSEGEYYDNVCDTSNFYFALNGYDYGGGDYIAYISLGDWLSTISTIISLIIILFICCLFIKKIYNICAHIIG